MVVCDIQRSSDGGQTWQSLWVSDSSRPAIAAGMTSGTLPANPAISFNPTDRLIFGLSATSPSSAPVSGTVCIRIPATS
jgi:hypothetical protein